MNASGDDTNITLVNAAARLLLASIIAATALTACDEKTPAPTTPLAGWDRARWGMTASEIRTAYPAAAPQKRDTHDYGGGRKYYCDLTLSGTTIAGYDFTVQFLMDNSDKLAVCT
jgi:hypothetical protein